MQSNEKSSYLNRIQRVEPVHLARRNVDCDLPSDPLPQKAIGNFYVNSQLRAGNVHVNPYFKPQNSTTVYLNPNICTKSLIHVNPRIIHDIANSNKFLQNNVSVTNVNSATLDATSTSKTDNNINQGNIKKSIYVNPTLLKKLSSSSEKKSTNLKEFTQRPVASRLKFVENTNNSKPSAKKTSNSNIVLLSRRKLVRVTRVAKSTSTIPIVQNRLQKCIGSTERKNETISQKPKIKSLANNTLHSTNVRSNLPKLSIDRSVNKFRMSKYKIDRIASSTSKTRKSVLLKKVTNNTSKIVTIGGIVYKSSKNKLIRKNCSSNCSLKRKSIINGKNGKFNIDKRQQICKGNLNRTLETNSKSKVRFSSNIPIKANYKNSFSNKAKQRSIRILQNKMRKNNQPCLIFQRFGSCPKNGNCSKRHDKKQISLCKKFLQGKCILDECPLSHLIGPEKMPTCKYFLDGCCIRDDCPYLHVKVSANTSICIDFLQGYCAKGNKCQRRHEYLCPEFTKSGNCIKGECCPYPHKSHSFNHEKSAEYSNKTHGTRKKHQVIACTAKEDSETTNPESRLRYYEISNSLSDDSKKTRASVKQIKEKNESLAKEEENKSETMACHLSDVKKKISINSYIPIDSP